jgi:dihydrolipoamide dehydrogenase
LLPTEYVARYRCKGDVRKPTTKAPRPIAGKSDCWSASDDQVTDPPLASVGRHDTERLVLGEADYRDQGRAKVEARAEGLVRLHADPDDGCLEGAELFCPGADHLGHLLAWSIEARQNTEALLNRPFYHPTLEEGLKPALRAICKQVGISPPTTRDEGSPSGG